MSVETARSRVDPGSLRLRTVTSLAGLPLVVGTVWVGGLWLSLAVALLAAAGLWEFDRLARLAGARPFTGIAAAAVAALLLAAHLGRGGWVGPVLALTMICAGAAQILPGRPAGESGEPGRQGALAGAGATVIAVLYIGYLFSYLIWLRRLQVGAAAPFLVLAGVWGADVLAFFVGLRWGRRCLAPGISPGKTVEGALAGLVGGTGLALLVGSGFGLPPLTAGAVGLVCAVTSQAGDLWESAVKRAAGVKDSGRLLPGHGGILDRFDGVLFAAAAGYYVMRVLGLSGT